MNRDNKNKDRNQPAGNKMDENQNVNMPDQTERERETERDSEGGMGRESERGGMDRGNESVVNPVNHPRGGERSSSQSSKQFITGTDTDGQNDL